MGDVKRFPYQSRKSRKLDILQRPITCAGCSFLSLYRYSFSKSSERQSNWNNLWCHISFHRHWFITSRIVCSIQIKSTSQSQKIWIFDLKVGRGWLPFWSLFQPKSHPSCYTRYRVICGFLMYSNLVHNVHEQTYRNISDFVSFTLISIWYIQSLKSIFYLKRTIRDIIIWIFVVC